MLAMHENMKISCDSLSNQLSIILGFLFLFALGPFTPCSKSSILLSGFAECYTCVPMQPVNPMASRGDRSRSCWVFSCSGLLIGKSGPFGASGLFPEKNASYHLCLSGCTSDKE